jgi:hypothetical protein
VFWVRAAGKDADVLLIQAALLNADGPATEGACAERETRPARASRRDGDRRSPEPEPTMLYLQRLSLLAPQKDAVNPRHFAHG